MSGHETIPYWGRLVEGRLVEKKSGREGCCEDARTSPLFRPYRALHAGNKAIRKSGPLAANTGMLRKIKAKTTPVNWILSQY